MAGRGGEEWPLVGRTGELARVRSVLAADRPEVDAVLLAGPEGVGKSRLARAVVETGEQLRLRCAHVLATGAASAIPLGVLVPLLTDEAGWDSSPGDELGWVVERLRGHGDRLLIVVDDAPLLDAASATVLRRLVQDGSSLLVMTARSEALTSPALARLSHELRVERLEVGSLDRDEVAELAAAMLGDPVDGACAQRLWTASHGNPLFLRELILGAVTADALRREQDVWRLSGALTSTTRLAELIGARLVDLGEEQRAALHLIALGEPLQTDWLPTLGIDCATAEELEARELVVTRVEDGRATLRLAHPLYGEVLREDLPTMARLSINRRLADTFETVGDRRRDALRGAVWRLEGGGPVDPVLMLEGARRAYFARQTDLAERLAREAIAAGITTEAGILLAQVLGELGRHDERHDLLGQLESAAPTPELQALVVMELSLAAFWGLNRGEEARAALATIESGLAPGPWREEVTASRATLELLSGRPLQALALATPLLGSATDRVQVAAAVGAVPALAVSGRGDDAVALADQVVLTHLALGDQEVLSSPGVHVIARGLGLTESGRLEEADSTLTIAYEVAVGSHNTIGQAWAALLQGRLRLLTGQLDAAARAFREGAAVFARLAQDGPRRWCGAGLVLVAAQQARPDAAAAALAELDALGPNCMLMMEPDVIRARAWEAEARGDSAAAHRLLIDAATGGEASGTLALAAAAWHDLARLGDAEPAADALTALAPAVQGDLIPTRAAHATALAEHDATGLKAAADRFEALGALLLAAEAVAAASAELRRRQRTRQATALGDRAAALIARCGTVRTPALGLRGRAAELTRREREVATLAIRGLPSRAIATRLRVSVRTVESHLQRAYTKLGVSGREALATALEP